MDLNSDQKELVELFVRQEFIIGSYISSFHSDTLSIRFSGQEWLRKNIYMLLGLSGLPNEIHE